MTYARRRVDLKFQLGKGSFGEDGSDTVTLEGLRVSASIVKTGGASMSNLQLRVYGMSLDVMNKLSILGKPLLDGRFNLVTISAGNTDTGLAVAFVGIITEAWIEAASAPDVVFIVTAHTGYVDALKPVPPVSFNGSVDAALIVSGMAAQFSPPLTFENGGVSVQLSSPYLPGTLREQALSVAKAANFNLFIDDTTLAIWPAGGTRQGLIPYLSPETGLVGYPTHTQNGILLMTEFNPSLVFGGQVLVQSSFTPACGTWAIFAVAHELESETPGGKWFTRIECATIGHEVPIAG